MSLDERLAWVVAGLKRTGLKVLVMGGHAVRFYGLQRTTVDFDFQLSAEDSASLADRLKLSGLFSHSVPQEVLTWRGAAFRRFLLGCLPNGREEWLEFWVTNHLLPPYEILAPRAVTGMVAGEEIQFVGLTDLIHAKETERNEDWLDIHYLEEALDERNLAALTLEGRCCFLAQLRSRRGFERALANGLFDNAAMNRQAFEMASIPITRGYLLPFLMPLPTAPPRDIPDFLLTPLRQVAGSSPRHLALVEAIRRHYQQTCMARDREDKAKFLRA